MIEPYLIVGLGNPGDRYVGTRHNIGYDFIKEFAKKYLCTPQKKKNLYGELAKATIADKQVFLFRPTTYMNLSGKAIVECINYYKISLEKVLVVVDEVDLLLGQIRIRAKGSAGTHNGLKDIEKRLLTKEYARLRVGIGPCERELLQDFVLQKFTSDERQILEGVYRKVEATIEIWLNYGMMDAMLFANTHLKNI